MDPFHEPNAVQVKVALDGLAPAVWRRFVLPWT